jgi:putative aldouronate transport system permease protein
MKGKILSSVNNKNGLIGNIMKYKLLYIMLIPGIAYFILFKYVPMYGIIIAFKDFKFKAGILGSKWIGLHYFKLFFNSPDFFRLLRNTLVISLRSLQERLLFIQWKLH